MSIHGVQRQTPIIGEQRVEVRKEVVRRYLSGTSTRTIAAQLDRSYGWVRNLLTEAGVQMRPRGGPNGRRRS